MGSWWPGGSGWILGLSGTAENLSLPALFQTYDNFGQATLRSEHIQGAVSAAGTINLEWDLSGKWMSDGLLSNLEYLLFSFGTEIGILIGNKKEENFNLTLDKIELQ